MKENIKKYLTKFHKDCTINVTARVLIDVDYSHLTHVFQPDGTICDLVQDIIEANLLKMYHEDMTVNVASRVLTRKKGPRPGGKKFLLVQYIISTIDMTKFHDDRTLNVIFRVSTMQNSPPFCGYVFQQTRNIFEIIQDIIRTNVLNKFYNAAPPGGHVFKAHGAIFELVQYMIGKDLLTKFHEDRTINVASMVFYYRIYYSHISKYASCPGGHVFQPTGISFELV
ncbi:hypothetical protein DPMN_035566 [Dreissena polymorpha]|uniref:Uncharacterized protein n=1 Tax=Dreissena polymorpha TaxID=45954 RepID=A0A9D4MC33_DREPO|nr:hypothetical protein DPMN_035566 [Dreissena polymorpha]